MEFFGAGALIFTIFFRGTCIPIFLTGRPIFYRGIPIFLTGRPREPISDNSYFSREKLI